MTSIGALSSQYQAAMASTTIPAPLRTADDVVTAITEAATLQDARAILRTVRTPLLHEVADLLYVDEELPPVALRKAIIDEARDLWLTSECGRFLDRSQPAQRNGEAFPASGGYAD